MKKQLFKIGLVLSITCNLAMAQSASNTVTPDTAYLSAIITQLNKQWPTNRTINLVFHGHSVPSGYFKTPVINTLGSYPYLLLSKLNAKYPYAVINIIKTCIGGENSEQGEKRFKKDVLTHKPDVVFIDYALNDRNLGLERARTAWEKMIKAALKKNIKVVLLTPTPDVTENILDPNAPLAQHTAQIISLGAKYHTPVIDSYQQFKNIKAGGQSLEPYMAQFNHINEKGHEIVAQQIAVLFNAEQH
ncbi:GDSL-type esterase/lipase family protein [Mucilaginibacter sp.]|uniref:SGNH/GDSL hydrolase family protein n=2 Tax=Mucilaginibacter sp. TaxID=1882438 RepID=UPI0025E6C91E|nr:GDSL-type esterase/lipase family protein [Mucilaginibacter sp.]